MDLNTIKDYYNKPFFELLELAHDVHKNNWDINEIEIAVLCNIKTGACEENCSYCPQSVHYNTGLKPEKIMKKEDIIEAARKAKAVGAKRFCMAAAWRGPNDKQVDYLKEVIEGVKNLGLEVCGSLGLLEDGQAEKLKEFGLDYYNHNIDSSEDFYNKIITTRKFEDRIDTLQKARDAGINLCCGGILGMGETIDDRLSMLSILSEMKPNVESVPINKLIAIPGTPLADRHQVDTFEFVRFISITRIAMPKSRVRFAAGRESTNEAFQALCFYAGVNSIFYGEKLLTANNQKPEKDDEMFKKLNLKKCTI